jgi:hypothetical protein
MFNQNFLIMERTINPDEGKILWKKTDGTFRLPDRRLVRKGDTFWARLEDIPIPFRDTIVPVTQEGADQVNGIPAEKIEAVETVYTKLKRDNGNWWDIIDKQGKVVNEKALREEQADDYLNALK